MQAWLPLAAYFLAPSGIWNDNNSEWHWSSCQPDGARYTWESWQLATGWSIFLIFLINAYHIRRFQEYFNHIHFLIGNTTLLFLQFWYQNGVNILFLLVKPLYVCYIRLYEKIARWRHNWSIGHLSVKTRIYWLVVQYQESNE